MTLKSLIPPLALILAVMGTILAGIATPTEAAGLGALGALLLAIFNRKLNWPVFRDSAFATMKTTAMVMMLFTGGTFFSTVFLGMGGGDVVADLMIGSGLNRWIVLAIMMFIVFIMGMFIDWAAILLITVPVFMPIAMELGFDPLWFSLLMCVNLQTSFVTPPFGYALFYFAGVAPPEFTMMHIYRGIIPFVALQLIGLVIIAVFPGLITWLPSLFFGS
jgi:tripartite ATP-independent transporter DctM subunit